MQEVDLAVLYFFNRTLASPALDTVMSAVTNVHYWMPVYVLAGLFLIWRYKWRGLWILLAAVLLVSLTDSLAHYLIKPLVDRPRPCELIGSNLHAVPWIRLPDGMRWDESFPSNHALNNFAIATFFSLVFRRRWLTIALFACASIISIGRVYEGVHYPSDVVGGAILGLLFGAVAVWRFGKFAALKPSIRHY